MNRQTFEYYLDKYGGDVIHTIRRQASEVFDTDPVAEALKIQIEALSEALVERVKSHHCTD